MDHMTIAILGLAFTTLTQIVSAVWWASRVSQQIDELTRGVQCMSGDMRRLRDEVTAHDKSIAVIHATTQRPKPNGDGSKL